MYNRYLDQIPADHPAAKQDPAASHTPQTIQRPAGPQTPSRGWSGSSPSGLLGEITNGLGGLLGGLFDGLSGEQFDAGDLLLALIILLLFLEGDDIEVIVTLGLMLLLGLGE